MSCLGKTHIDSCGRTSHKTCIKHSAGAFLFLTREGWFLSHGFAVYPIYPILSKNQCCLAMKIVFS